jgi:hypothetical protein
VVVGEASKVSWSSVVAVRERMLLWCCRLFEPWMASERVREGERLKRGGEVSQRKEVRVTVSDGTSTS